MNCRMALYLLGAVDFLLVRIHLVNYFFIFEGKKEPDVTSTLLL